MFIGSDKKFRKGVPTSKPTSNKSNKPGAAAANSATESSTLHVIDVVEKAKNEREIRRTIREQSQKVIHIQAWWRGRRVSYQEYLKRNQVVDGKLADIEKLSSLFKTTVFSPPPEICMDLLRSILVTNTISSDYVHRLAKFSKLALIPSLSQLDARKNFALLLVSNQIVFRKLFYRIMSILRLAIEKTKSTLLGEDLILLKVLICLTSQKGEDDLEQTFRLIRREVVALGYFQELRGNVCVATKDLVNSRSDGDETLFMTPNLLRPDSPALLDGLVQLSCILVEADRDCVENRLSLFAREVMPAALLTAVLAESTMYALANWVLFPMLLTQLSKSTLALPPSTHDVFTSGQWLLGNLSTFGRYLRIDDSAFFHANKSDPQSSATATITTTLTPISLEALSDYLLLCSVFIRRYYIPGALQGRGGVVWTKNGASLIASGVPKMLQQQLQSLLHPSLTSALYHRIFEPIHFSMNRASTASRGRTSDESLITSGNPCFVTGTDAKDIANALSTSAVALARDMLQEQRDSSVWFSSKWAKTLIKSVSSQLGVTTTESTSKSSGQQLSASTAMLSCTNVIADASSDCRCHACSLRRRHIKTRNDAMIVSPSAISALCRLWGLILPAAAASPSQSAPWRYLSQLTFSSNGQTIDSLWLAALLCPLGGNKAATEITTKSPKPPDSAYQSSSVSSTFGSFLSVVFSSSGSSSSSSKTEKSGEAAREQRETITAASSEENKVAVPDKRRPEKFASFIEASGVTTSWRLAQLQSDDFFLLLATLCALLSQTLTALDDSELYTAQKPLPLAQILRLVRVLKTLLLRALQARPDLLVDTAATADTTGLADAAVKILEPEAEADSVFCVSAFRCFSSVLSDLHSRWSRRPFCSSALWEVPSSALSSGSLLNDVRQKTAFGEVILRYMPWVIGFHDRSLLFREIVHRERLSIQGDNEVSIRTLMGANPRSKGTVVRVRRARVLEDGMAAFEKVGADTRLLKDRMVVRYVNEFGEEEAGIDAGGLFKDLVTDLSTRIFDPSYGLFCLTSDQTMYPNPSANMLYPQSEIERLYNFLGRVLGKAMYEDITVQHQFAHFFLAFMHGRYNYVHLFNDLQTLDKELHKNLMFLKTYEGDIRDLSLSFSVTDDSLGGQKEIDIIPGGSNVPVTSRNKHRYIDAVAKYYLHDRIKLQAHSFFRGLNQVMSPEWLSMFCAPELQVLISGVNDGINIADLKRHTQYAGGFTSFDRVISWFWAVLEEASETDRALLLKFVTACSRPPSLGFGALRPPFTIQKAESGDGDARLPTASTCFNTLKLPSYSSQRILKEKLLTSIRSGAGFDLS